MRILISNDITNETKNLILPPGKNPVRIGSGSRCDIRLQSNLIPENAAAISNEGDGKGWQFWPLFAGCVVGDDLLLDRQPVPLKHQQSYQLQPYTLTIYLDSQDEMPPDDAWHRSLDDRSDAVVSSIHRQLVKSLQGAELGGDVDNNAPSDDYIIRLEQAVENVAASTAGLPRDDFSFTEISDHMAGQHLRSRLLRKLVNSRAAGDAAAGDDNSSMTPWALLRTLKPELEREVDSLMVTTQERAAINLQSDLSLVVNRLDREFWSAWRVLRRSINVDLRRYMFLAQLKKEIKDIWFGLGPLEDLLENPTITEIMVNDADHVFIEKDGAIENSGRRFVKDLTDIIQRIVTRVQRKIDSSTPMVDARLLDGSRVNAVIKPLTVKGPCLTIRRFPHRVMTFEDLIRRGSLSPTARDFLSACVLLRCNILVAGGTGTGKTTFLNALSAFIPDKERIITIEDTAELRLTKSHVVGLETKQKNIEGQGGIDIRMLVKNALRMRPDRIIVGECRGGESLDMLQAMNTGHDGSMTTMHANSPHDVALRLEVMVQQNSDSQLPVSSIHRQIASALDLIVQLRAETTDAERPGERRRTRVVAEIVEVVGIDEENGGLRLKPIFKRFSDGTLRATGFLPTFIDELLTDGGLKLDHFFDLANRSGS